MSEEPWGQVHCIVASGRFTVRHGPNPRNRRNDGYRKVDVVAAKPTVCIVILDKLESMQISEVKHLGSINTHPAPLTAEILRVPQNHVIVRSEVKGTLLCAMNGPLEH